MASLVAEMHCEFLAKPFSRPVRRERPRASGIAAQARMARMEDRLLKIENMFNDTCLLLGLALAVQLQSQVIAPIQSRFDLLEKMCVLIDFAAIARAARSILTKGSDSEQADEEFTPERLRARTGSAMDAARWVAQ